MIEEIASTDSSSMAEELPQEALVRVFHFLPIKQRSRFACVCQSWRQAATVDAVQVKLQKQHVPSYLHVALPDGAAQMQAAACPLMSLARSADLTWSSAAATGTLLESMPSLERLAFTSMSSVPQPVDSSSGLQSLKSLTNLQSLQLNTSDAAPLLEAMPSVPHSVREIELHLTGEDWQTSALDKIADQLGSQVSGSARFDGLDPPEEHMQEGFGHWWQQLSISCCKYPPASRALHLLQCIAADASACAELPLQVFTVQPQQLSGKSTSYICCTYLVAQLCPSVLAPPA